MSKTMAQKIAITAPYQSCSSAKRMAVAPEQRPRRVSALGTTRLIDRSSSRSRCSEAHCLGVNLSSAIAAGSISEFRQDGLSSSDALAFRCQHLCPRREIHIEPAAKTNNSETFSPAHSLALDKAAF